MRAAISLLVLLLSMCGVQTESHGPDASTQDVSTELKELRDMVVDLRATVRHTQDDVKVLEADNILMQQRLTASETKVEALERALQHTRAETRIEVDNLKRETVIENAAQETELTAVKTRLAATMTEVEDLEKEIRAAPKVAFSAGLTDFGYIQSGMRSLNVVFSRVITNVGEAYSSTTGFFTAPVRGVYYFRFTVMDKMDSRWMVIRMYKNGQQLMYLAGYGTHRMQSYLSSGLTLQLEKGDAVNLVIPAGYRLGDDAKYNYSTFSGFLLFPL